jgi:hypothetical protein
LDRFPVLAAERTRQFLWCTDQLANRILGELELAGRLAEAELASNGFERAPANAMVML